MTEPRHQHGHAAALLAESVAFAGHSAGYREAELVGAAAGARHSYLVLGELEPGGHVDPHAHSHEEAFYVLEGELELTTAASVAALPTGAFGLIDVDQVHSWRSTGSSAARWISMNAPLPLATDPAFGQPSDGGGTTAVSRVRPHALVSTDVVGVAGYRPADLSGVALDWLVDEALGADLVRLFVVRYAPGGSMARHDHPVEECYLVLHGEVFATADDVELELGPGDFLWTGVGCVHSFENRTDADVVWIETQAPHPPRDHKVRFVCEQRPQLG